MKKQSSSPSVFNNQSYNKPKRTRHKNPGPKSKRYSDYRGQGR